MDQPKTYSQALGKDAVSPSFFVHTPVHTRAVVNIIDIVNMSNIKDKGRKYDNFLNM